MARPTPDESSNASPYELSEVPDEHALGETPPPVPRADLPLIDRPGRWCPACGYDLTRVGQPPCPRCERMFIPEDPSTYSSEPVEIKHPYWTDKPRVAGYVLIPVFLIGRGVINATKDDWSEMFAGSGGSAGVILGAMFGLLLIAWLIVTPLLGAIALSDFYNPRVVYCLLAGFAFGIVITIGLSPAVIFAGMLAGLFAGLIRAWLARM